MFVLLIFWFINDLIVAQNCADVAFFLFFSSSHKEDAAEVETAAKEHHQPAAAKESETPDILSPAAQPGSPPAQEEPREPEKPTTQPATPLQVLPKPADEHTALALEPELPSKPEPQHVGVDEQKLADVMLDGQESFVNSQEPACEAENQLWAAVEEPTAETGEEQGLESSEGNGLKEEKQKEEEEEVVIGG